VVNIIYEGSVAAGDTASDTKALLQEFTLLRAWPTRIAAATFLRKVNMPHKNSTQPCSSCRFYKYRYNPIKHIKVCTINAPRSIDWNDGKKMHYGSEVWSVTAEGCGEWEDHEETQPETSSSTEIPHNEDAGNDDAS